MAISRDVGRIEAFSDAVFGFALTLLVVSLEVPRTYDDLMVSVRGLPAFAACFALLLLIWQEHHSFFRRYAVRDGVLIWLNGLLLFVVLFYVYPLKFLMTMLLGPNGVLFGGRPAGIEGRDMAGLMTMYGIGFMSLFAILAAMHWRVLACVRRQPEPTVDGDQLRLHLGQCLVYVGVGLASTVVARVGPSAWAPGVAGFMYGLTGPAHWLYYRWATRPEPAATEAAAERQSEAEASDAS